MYVMTHSTITMKSTVIKPRIDIQEPASAQAILECGNHHGEGILWNQADQCVWWTDIEGRTLWTYAPTTQKATSYEMPERVCCFAPRSSGGLVLGFESGFVLWMPGTKQWQRIAAFESESQATRMNDGRTDRQGRFVVGGMNELDGQPTSNVWRLNTDLSMELLFDGVSCANSICFSPDGKTMYFADSPRSEIEAFQYPGNANKPHDRRTIAHLAKAQGVPDGSCVDAEGYLWNAVWEGGRVERRSPNGALDQTIFLPVRKPTCCAFGGENLDTLYITTSRLMSTQQELANEPLAGSLFAVKPGIRGLLDTPFSG
jgi:L-arabinonolactonase